MEWCKEHGFSEPYTTWDYKPPTNWPPATHQEINEHETEVS